MMDWVGGDLVRDCVDGGRIAAVYYAWSSSQYLDNPVQRFLKCLKVVACVNSIHEAAVRCAEKWGIPYTVTIAQRLAGPKAKVVLNLTLSGANETRRRHRRVRVTLS